MTSLPDFNELFYSFSNTSPSDLDLLKYFEDLALVFKIF